jgi:uncharacterized protein YdbL (DUF1318 family)
MNFFATVKYFAVAAVMTAGLGFALPAAAIDLDQARTQGLVGERADGLVAAVAASPAADVRALVDSINAARLAEYKSIAQKNGTPLDAVQTVAGDKQLQRAKENKWFVMDASGRWSKP